jgi:hypothetical protein
MIGSGTIADWEVLISLLKSATALLLILKLVHARSLILHPKDIILQLVEHL